MSLEWSSEYSVGVAEIDGQHEKFVGIMDSLYDAIEKKEAGDRINGILDELVKYAVFHFETEERYFDKFNYENSKEHKEEHRKLEGKVAEFSKSKDSYKDIYAFCYELLDFLENWLVDHLVGQDKKYTKCFNEHGLH